MPVVGSEALASWEVPEVRRRLAAAVTFTRRYHARAYCIATLPVELAAQVADRSSADLAILGVASVVGKARVITLNRGVLNTGLHPLTLLHECCHHLLGLHFGDCTGKMESREERDVWLASALVAVSAPLIALVLDGHESVSEIAWRCRVPEPLVMIRVGLAVVLGEHQGPLGEALDLIRYQLGRLDLWIESMKLWLCRRARPA